MSKQFEFIPPPESVLDIIEYLQKEIAKTMTIPVHLLRPETHSEERARRYHETETMRRELVHIVEAYWPLVALIKDTPDEHT